MTQRTLRAVGLSALIGGSVTAALLAGAASAGADTFVRLPGGTAKGEGIQIVRSEESARVSASMAANGVSRTTWVSGQITLYAPNLKPAKAGPSVGAAGETTLPGSNGTATNGAAATLSTGYIIGCQVNIKGLQGGLSGSLTPTAPSLSGTLTVPLAAGVLAPIGFVLSPAVGAILMSVSTIVVALNAQLLRRTDLDPEHLAPLERPRSQAALQPATS